MTEKRIIRLSESELKGIIKEAAKNVIREMDEKEILTGIAQKIREMGTQEFSPGECELEVPLGNGNYATVCFEIIDNTVIFAREKPEFDDIYEDYDILVKTVFFGEDEVELNDNNNIIKDALENVISVMHGEEAYDRAINDDDALYKEY